MWTIMLKGRVEFIPVGCTLIAEVPTASEQTTSSTNQHQPAGPIRVLWSKHFYNLSPILQNNVSWFKLPLNPPILSQKFKLVKFYGDSVGLRCYPYTIETINLSSRSVVALQVPRSESGNLAKFTEENCWSKKNRRWFLERSHYQGTLVVGCIPTNVPLLEIPKPRIPRDHSKYHGHTVRGTPIVPWH